jgi:hypothetical protein
VAVVAEHITQVLAVTVTDLALDLMYQLVAAMALIDKTNTQAA